MAKLVDSLISSVKRNVTAPASQVLLLDDDILDFANDMMQTKVVPLLLSVRQEYFVTYKEIPTVANQKEYDIPYRAIGRALRDIKLKDSANTVRDLSLVQLEDEHLFTAEVSPHSVYFRGDQFVLLPKPANASYTIQMWYNLAPSALVVSTSACKVTAISGSDLTVDAVPSTIGVSSTLDIVQGKSGNRILSMDVTPTALNGLVFTFASGDVPSTVSVGDYIALAGETPVVQLPNEVCPYLELLTSQQVLGAIGDYEGLASLEKEQEIVERNMKLMLEPRLQGESTKIINRRSLLRSRNFGYYRGRLF